MKFEDIQKNWQQQQAPQQPGKPLESEITGKIKAVQQKVIRTYTLMSVVLCLTLAFFVYLLRFNLNPNTIWYNVGAGLTLGAALALGLIHWFKSMPWKKQVGLSSKVYVEHVLKSFRFLNTANQKLTPFFMVVILVGMNLVYLDIFWDKSFKQRLVMHLLLNATMLAVGAASLYYSKQHNNQAYGPIIGELEELQQKLEEV